MDHNTQGRAGTQFEDDVVTEEHSAAETDGPGDDEQIESRGARPPRSVARRRESGESAWEQQSWTPVAAEDPDAGDAAPGHDGADGAGTRATGDGRDATRRVYATARLVWDPVTHTWRRPDEPSATDATAVGVPTGGGSGLRSAIIGGVAGALAALLVLVGGGTLLDRRPTAVERTLDPGVTSSVAQGGIVEIAAKARPWVVNVRVTGRQRGIFGSQQFQGNGSGVIIRSDGHAITNAHVVDNADSVEVTLNTGKKVPATVVGSDPDTDVAVIKIAQSDLTPAVIGSAANLAVGETVVAIGSPLGLEQTVTSGIVSALSRTVDRPDGPPLVDMIQTDAAVTQGNSGGALVNGAGALIGINTAIAASPTVGAEGIAFAIPVDVAKAVADELIDSGRATHPWLGVSGADVDPAAADELGTDSGALIFEIVPGGPAAAAGLQERDVIVSMDGEKIDGMQDLVIAIRQRKTGAEVTLEIVRNRERLTVKATLGDKPQNL